MPIEIESPEQRGYGSIACNLSESSVSDLRFHELEFDAGNLVLAYGDHSGKKELRETIAAMYPGISADDVLITSGAVNALFIVMTSLLEAKDRVVVQFPNYSTNTEVAKTMDCELLHSDVVFEEEYRLNFSRLRAQLNPSPKLISVTSPHNPTGVMLSEEDIAALVEETEKQNAFLLVDETYRDLLFTTPPPLAATLSGRAISISSLSKAYGLPGIRIGWIICRNKSLMKTFLAAKEQIVLCNSVLDEEVAHHFLVNRNRWTPKIKARVLDNFHTVKAWMHNNEFLEWVVPQGGVICFPRFKAAVDIDIPKFYRGLEQRSTLVGAGHWFGMNDRYFRIGYGWPDPGELGRGLDAITSSAHDALVS